MDDAAELRRDLRDLVALTALPAIWLGQSPQVIVESFTDALLRTLRVDFVYARLPAAGGSGSLIEALSLDPQASDLAASDIAHGLRSVPSSEGPAFPPPISSSGASVGLASASIGPPGPASGIVVAGMRRDDFPSSYDRLLVRVGANQLAIALQGAELRAVQERQRLSRELHDSVSQALYAIVLDIATAQRIGAADPARLEAILRDAYAQAEAGLAEMRALIFELRPEFLSQEGLVAALQRQVAAVRARHQLSITMDATDEPEADPAVKEALYRVGQEALNNIAKHASARAVVITLEASASELVLRVRDDGRGFDAGKSFPGHLGLRSMRERAASVGGVILISSAPGQGTEVTIRVPRLKTA
ncbi:MAG TPA: sensor histidine kinase [Candidatus Dormibacteraeota bacterium]|nr:sensor histidine kinase [Candidatus Dormibacteraeota bacterium]